MTAQRSATRVVRISLLLLPCFAVLVGFGCKTAPHEAAPGTRASAPVRPAIAESADAPSATTEVTSTPTSSARAPAPGSHSAQPLDATIEDKLYSGKCPSWVRGARTTLEDRPDGLRARITADSEPAVSEIRDRSRYLAAGKSQGGDATGRCPISREARIEVVDVEHGAELTVRPPAGGSVKDLRSRARAMAAQLPKP